MSQHLHLILFFSFLIFSSCKQPEQTTSGTVKGQITWASGNMMPSIGTAPQQPTGVERTIHFAVPVKDANIKRNAEGLIDKAGIEIVESAKSNADGQFEIALPAGKYSVLTEEDGGLFANSMNGQGELNPVTVTSGGVATMNIVVNYKAVY